MPSESDIALLEGFLRNTVEVYQATVSDSGLSEVERDLLLAAVQEFMARQSHILASYQELSDADIQDAGIGGAQLQAKVDLARRAGEPLRQDRKNTETAKVASPRKRPLKRKVRRWIKSAKVLAGSLKTLLPGAEALQELLDLLDSALDS